MAEVAESRIQRQNALKANKSNAEEALSAMKTADSPSTPVKTKKKSQSCTKSNSPTKWLIPTGPVTRQAGR